MRALDRESGGHLEAESDEELYRQARAHVDQDHPEMQPGDEPPARGMALVALRLVVLIVLSVGALIGLAGSHHAAGAAEGITIDKTIGQLTAQAGGGDGDAVSQEDFTTFNESVSDSGSGGTANGRQSTSVELSDGTLFHSDANSDASGSFGTTRQLGRAEFTLTEDTPFVFKGQIATASNSPSECTTVLAIIDSMDGSGFRVFRQVASPSRCGTPAGTSFDEQVVLPAGKYFVAVSTTTQGRSSSTQATFNASSSWDVDLTGGDPGDPCAQSASSQSFTTAAVGQCAPSGHLVFTRPVFGDHLLVASADGSNPSAPLSLAPGIQDDFKQGAWSPDGERLAFMHQDEIFTMTAGGSDVRQLTDTPGNNGFPDWSPNGQKIAFVSTRNGNNEIYTMDAFDGSNPRRLTQNAANDIDPAWSPGGRKLLFSSDRRGGQFDIFSMKASGTDPPVRLTNHPAQDINPAFAPGGLIVFDTLRDGNNEIYTMKATGADQENLSDNAGNDFDPAVSPDGNFVAFVSDRDGNQEIYTMPVLGGVATNLTNNAEEQDREPDWGNSACTLYGTSGNDTIERSGHTCGGPGDDTLTGAGAADVLDGGKGDDTLFGKGGNDRLFGGDEIISDPAEINDRIEGGEGFDEIFAGGGNDVAAGGGGGDFVEGGEGADDLEGDVGTASPGADVIRGGPGPDTIGGGPGDDSIRGDEGTDTIDGDEGKDTVRGGPDKDIISACDEVRDKIFGGPSSQDEATFDRGVDVLDGVEVRRRC